MSLPDGVTDFTESGMTTDAGKVYEGSGCLSTLWRPFGAFIYYWGWFHLVTGTVLKLTIRDQIPYLAAMFYASPAIVLAVLALILGLIERRREQKNRAQMLFWSIPVFLGWWHVSAYFGGDARPREKSDVDVVCWNIQYVNAGWPAIMARIEEENADVIGLVEVGGGYSEVLRELRSHFPEFDVQFVRMGIVMIRGEWYGDRYVSLDKHGTAARMQGTLDDGREIDLVLVDIYGFPMMPRRPAFAALERLIQQEEPPLGPNAIVMGDFNTPPDSAWFDPLRESYDNAFEAAGSGYQASWPAPVPVLGIDQIWVPTGRAVSAQMFGTGLSDHRLVRATVRFDEPAIDPEAAEERHAN